MQKIIKNNCSKIGAKTAILKCLIGVFNKLSYHESRHQKRLNAKQKQSLHIIFFFIQNLMHLYDN